MRKIVITIDGYSACGKSSTAKGVAAALNYQYIDTGAMYRAITLYFLEHYIDPTNPKAVGQALASIEVSFLFNQTTCDSDVYLNGINVAHQIRTMKVSQRVSEVASLKEVREAMVKQQQRLGKRKAMVMEGRDIGTVVFPDAELKVFMTADLDVRAARRQKEWFEKDQLVGLEDVRINLRKRDQMDTTRKEGPLVKPQGSIVVDTTHMRAEEQIGYITQLAIGKMVSVEN